MPHQSNNTVYVYIDYYQKGLWGGWLSKHSWWERVVIPTRLPNIMHSNPVHICDIAKRFMDMHGKTIQFVFSDSVKFLHQVESRTIQ